MDGPNQGQTYKSTKWTDPTRVKLTSPQSGQIPPRVKLTSPQSGRIPPRVKLIHKVDRPNEGQTCKSTKWTDPTKGQHGPQSGRTQPGSNLQVHKMDGSHQRSTRSTKWTDPTRVKLVQVQKVDGPNKGQTYITPKKRTDPTNVENPNTHNGRTQPVHKIIQVHKVDGHQGSRPHSTE